MEKTKPKINNPQHCVFILWSNGFKYASEIIDIIRNYPEIEVQKIFLYETDNIKKFVDLVYSKDDTPKIHIKNKTKYIRRSNNPNVAVILAKNHKPNEMLRGRGEFRHIECQRIKELKDIIREKFNPRQKNGERTHEHVIHATDSEHHVDHLLKVLGYKEGLNHFKKTPSAIIDVPHHIRTFDHFTIKKISIDSLYCRMITGTRDSFSTEIMPLEKSPHYQFTLGNKEIYEKYLEEFSGILITDDYSQKKFEILREGFSYLSNPNELNYILVEEFQLGKYVIRNGLHRASIIKNQGKKKIISLVIQ